MNYEYSIGSQKIQASVSMELGLDPILAEALEVEINSALETEILTELMEKFLREEWLVKHPNFFSQMNVKMANDATHKLFYEEFAKSYLTWATNLAGANLITKTKY